MTESDRGPDGRPMVAAIRPGGVAVVAHREPRDVERRPPRLVAPRLGKHQRRLRGGGRGGPVRRLDRFGRPGGSMSSAATPVVLAAPIDQRLGAHEQGPRRAPDRRRADAARRHGRDRGGQAERLVDAARRRREPRRAGRPGRRLRANPPAREHWDAFSRSRRRALLEWITQAKRPETRANRIAEAAENAARNEVPPRFRPRD